MNDNKLKFVNVRIKFSTTSGYSSDETIGGTGTQPDVALLSAIDELARIAAIAGLEERARVAVESAINRVAVFNAKQEGGA